MNTTIPGMDGYKPIKDRDTIEQYQEFSWIIKG